MRVPDSDDEGVAESLVPVRSGGSSGSATAMEVDAAAMEVDAMGTEVDAPPVEEEVRSRFGCEREDETDPVERRPRSLSCSRRTRR